MKTRTPQPPIEYYDRLLHAFVWGEASLTETHTLEETLFEAEVQGLKVDKFKRKKLLPRIALVLDLVRKMVPVPTTVLDIGCGRGTAMWPMIEAFPEMLFTGVDAYEGRAKDLHRLTTGGIPQIQGGYCLGAESLNRIGNKSYDLSLILEVLEHLETDKGVEAAAKEALRVTKGTILVSVPSVPDWNPDHKRLFTAGGLKNIWLRAGAKSVTTHEVPKHFVLVVTPKV